MEKLKVTSPGDYGRIVTSVLEGNPLKFDDAFFAREAPPEFVEEAFMVMQSAIKAFRKYRQISPDSLYHCVKTLLKITDRYYKDKAKGFEYVRDVLKFSKFLQRLIRESDATNKAPFVGERKFRLGKLNLIADRIELAIERSSETGVGYPSTEILRRCMQHVNKEDKLVYERLARALVKACDFYLLNRLYSEHGTCAQALYKMALNLHRHKVSVYSATGERIDPKEAGEELERFKWNLTGDAFKHAIELHKTNEDWQRVLEVCDDYLMLGERSYFDKASDYDRWRCSILLLVSENRVKLNDPRGARRAAESALEVISHSDQFFSEDILRAREIISFLDGAEREVFES